MHTTVRQILRCQSGAVAVEFALIAPLLFALLFGTLGVGYAMGLGHSVRQLAAGAARASVSGLDAQERRALAQAYLDEAGTHYPLLDTEALDGTITLDGGATPGMTVALSYALDGTILGLLNGFFDSDLKSLSGEAYVAY